MNISRLRSSLLLSLYFAWLDSWNCIRFSARARRRSSSSSFLYFYSFDARIFLAWAWVNHRRHRSPDWTDSGSASAYSVEPCILRLCFLSCASNPCRGSSSRSSAENTRVLSFLPSVRFLVHSWRLIHRSWCPGVSPSHWTPQLPR